MKTLTLKELLDLLRALNPMLESIVENAGMDLCASLELHNLDRNNPDERYTEAVCEKILTHLDSASNMIEWITRPIIKDYTLHKNEKTDRYEYEYLVYDEYGNPHKHYQVIPCGTSVETLIYDDCEEREEWASLLVLHNGKDYYLDGHPELKLEGLRIRVRSNQPNQY